MENKTFFSNLCLESSEENYIYNFNFVTVMHAIYAPTFVCNEVNYHSVDERLYFSYGRSEELI